MIKSTHSFSCSVALFFFFFNDTATTEIYTLSLHDALPIFPSLAIKSAGGAMARSVDSAAKRRKLLGDRKSTRLNSSHGYISYAVFCLKKKNKPSDISATVNTNTPRCATLAHFRLVRTRTHT